MTEVEAKKNFKFLFERPFEPIFATKESTEGKVAFEVPKDFYTDRYKTVANSVSTRVGVEKSIRVHEVQHPDLKFTERIPIQGGFSLFNPLHQDIAGQLVQLLLDQPDADTFFTVSTYIRDRINPYLFQYAISVAVQHRKDTKDEVQLMPLVKQFPGHFIASNVFQQIREETTLIPEQQREPVIIRLNYTASPKEEEQRMSYFREDIGVNMHHWHWHLTYPTTGPQVVVDKDRRGELFYYMHSQIVARYNNDRFCNNLASVRPLNDLRKEIPEGYFPKILQGDVGRPYPPRLDNSHLHDLHRFFEDVVEVNDLERWSDRIHQAIDQGFVLEQNTGKVIPLDDVRGIDILGNMVESTALSPNRRLYGNLHNMGHNIISLCHDPENLHLEEAGVMSRVETAMRDPVFYRWHCYIDNIFKKFKERLTPYNASQLLFNGIQVKSVNLQITRGNAAPNRLLTFWQLTDVDLARGLDLGGERALVKFQHLQNAPFEYIINVDNSSGKTARGTCRIFLLPKFDERGIELNFRDQRLLGLEMDKFTVILNPGSNEIRRKSVQSSVTIPYERSLKWIASQDTPSGDDSEFSFCGCGWPEHLLLPKGTVGGTKFTVFVMISDYANDQVGEEPNGANPCNVSYSFCGLQSQKYPDARAMGFPFDRNTRFQENVQLETLNDFTSNLPNSTTNECTITFVSQVIDREK